MRLEIFARHKRREGGASRDRPTIDAHPAFLSVTLRRADAGITRAEKKSGRVAGDPNGKRKQINMSKTPIPVSNAVDLSVNSQFTVTPLTLTLRARPQREVVIGAASSVRPSERAGV